jgi:hypothetical protein
MVVVQPHLILHALMHASNTVASTAIREAIWRSGRAGDPRNECSSQHSERCGGGSEIRWLGGRMDGKGVVEVQLGFVADKMGSCGDICRCPFAASWERLGDQGGRRRYSSRNARYQDRAEWSLHIRERDPDSATHPE